MKAARNYETLVIAGCGTVGSGILTLGKDDLESFDRVLVVDADDERLERANGFERLRGDITDAAFLDSVLSAAGAPGILVNLCPDIDNVAVRRVAAARDMAYLDSSVSSIGSEPEEFRYSRLMPYTFGAVESRWPQWLCFGINPGLVEIVARMLIGRMRVSPDGFDVLIAEHDRLRSDGEDVAVGWSPQSLAEEAMLSPTLVVSDWRREESAGAGAAGATLRWRGETVDARLVAHEDIWNLAAVPGVRDAAFAYALDAGVMETLAGDFHAALERLAVPRGDDGITGMEEVLVRVRGIATGEERALVWATDHAQARRRHGVNAVQYQTAKGLLLALRLMQRTPLGLRRGIASASTLALSQDDWPLVLGAMDELGIEWTDATSHGVELAGREA